MSRTRVLIAPADLGRGLCDEEHNMVATHIALLVLGGGAR